MYYYGYFFSNILCINVLWVLSEIYYAIHLKSVQTDQKDKDKSSFRLLWLVIALSISVANSIRYLYGSKIYQGE